MKPINAKKFLLTVLSITMFSIVGCSDDNDSSPILDKPDDSSTPVQTFAPITLSIAHMNDHHSHLEPEGSQTFTVDNKTYRAQRGGFARIKTVFDELESTYGNGNFLKLHAGDAITGTSYFSFYKGDADADMMNTICFDAFGLGNHEFDEGDAGLKTFLDRLNGVEGNPNHCQTPILAANVKPKVGTPLAPSKVDDYIKPYVIKTTKEGVKLGIIGIDIQGKTKNSSRPLDSTEFLNEVTTAQNYINELKNQGIEHIVLLTHYTYDNDKILASKLTGVDVIIGGDSHTLLGDFTDYTQSSENDFGSQGDYPTLVTNKDGNTVCIGQSWEYTKAVGIMNISFDDKGNVSHCGGSQIIPIGQTLEGYNEMSGEFETLSATDNQSIVNKLLATKSGLLKRDLILPFAENATANAVLAPYTNKVSENLAKVIGKSTETLCLVRVPGTSRSTDIAGCENTAQFARGSDIAQVVAKAFLDGALRADFALQNAGGVRETILAGDITFNTAYTILPFGNTLVNLEITGQEVRNTLEDAIASHMDNNGSSGAHPYAASLRWDLDLTQSKNNRVRNIEVQNRSTGAWSAIDMNKTYVMVTNDYIAEGRDGYDTLGTIFKDKSKVEDTKLLYTQAFVNYIQKVGTLARPARDNYAHKTVVTTDGRLLDP